jgi:hypothetical protein
VLVADFKVGLFFFVGKVTSPPKPIFVERSATTGISVLDLCNALIVEQHVRFNPTDQVRSLDHV